MPRPRRINVDIGSVEERKAKKERAELLRESFANEQRARIQAMRDEGQVAAVLGDVVNKLEKEKEEQAARLKFEREARLPLGVELKAAVAEKKRQTELKIRREQALRDQKLMKEEIMAKKGGKKRKTRRKTRRKTKRKSRRKSRKNKKRTKRNTRR